MPDNVTLYCRTYDQLPSDHMRLLSEGVSGLSHTQQGADHVFAWKGYTMRCNCMPRSELPPHLHGFVSFAHRCSGGEAAPELGRPDHIVDAGALVGRMKAIGVHGLRSRESRRSDAELLDAADLIYRYHWAVVDARIAGREPPAGLDPGVVYERHYALNWLIGYGDQPWDDVTTDT